ncbi:MAG: hypothetical protein ACYCQH_04110 [Acidithiobacillus ferrooxidans]|jgi:hypothetical protein|uniref:Core-binding (CB) domain-containing protein n=1 Tax=mine drainage metagenome TaxID=410659 RepID=E6QDH6_9ZZZZ
MRRKRGKIWWIDFTAPNGERIRCSTKTTVKTEAQEFYDHLRAKAWRQAQLKERPDYFWDDAGLRWLDEKAHKASFVDDVQRLHWFQQYFRGHRLADLNKQIIMEAIEIKRKESSAATANRYLALIRAILRQCVEWDWMDTVPILKD